MPLLTALDPLLSDRIAAALGVRPVAAEPLPGGSTVAVLRVGLADGGRVVAKAGAGPLLLEAWMLGELARHSSLPLPAVLHAAEDLLLTHNYVQRGDLIVLTIGEPMGKSGGTNTMKIVRVGDHRG